MLIVEKKPRRRKIRRERLILLHFFHLVNEFSDLLRANRYSYVQISPLSTLESSFEALNVKKFDGDYRLSSDVNH